MTDTLLEDLLDVPSTAALAKCSEACIRKYLTTHRLSRHHFGRRVLVSRLELQGLVRITGGKAEQDRKEAACA